MATTRIMPLHIGKGRTESRAIRDIIDYVANPQKTDNGKLITGYGCDSRTADAEFAGRLGVGAVDDVRGLGHCHQFARSLMPDALQRIPVALLFACHAYLLIACIPAVL